MQDAERQTRTHLMQLFEERGIHPRSDLGQNFLIDLNIVEFVARNGEITSNDVVLEIGAGTGGMTTFLARDAAHVVSVEYDRNMFRMASDAVAPYNNVTLLNTDALKNKNNFAPVVLEEISKRLAEGEGRKLKLVANLPYNIATPVVSNLVATNLPWTRMVVTIQYELGLRMKAEPRDSHYGSLSVWLQSQCFVKMIKKLGPTVFWPRPKVDSAIMRISPHYQDRDKIADREFFHDYCRRVFNQRRKFMRSVVVGMYGKELSKPEIDTFMQEMGFTANTRAEEVDVKSHVNFANRLHAAINAETEAP